MLEEKNLLGGMLAFLIYYYSRGSVQRTLSKCLSRKNPLFYFCPSCSSFLSQSEPTESMKTTRLRYLLNSQCSPLSRVSLLAVHRFCHQTRRSLPLSDY